jgi:pyruvate dehydrogenase (quinone)
LEELMAKTAADNLCERLLEWNVTTIYGFPGDGINGILGALRRHQDQLRFVQTRHEDMAAFMACGHAKFTGEVGVCMATSGPGAIHLLNGLYDAKLDHQPVVAIVGQTFARAPYSVQRADFAQLSGLDPTKAYGPAFADPVPQRQRDLWASSSPSWTPQRLRGLQTGWPGLWRCATR